MRCFLFPRVFRTIGWILLVPTLLLGIMLLDGRLSFSDITQTIVNDAAITGIALGSLFITCSRERIEDEMTGAIRLNALLSSLYCYVAFLIICTIAVNGLDYFYVIAVSPVMLPLMFVVRFRYEMHKYYKLNSNEEQD